MVRLSTLWWDNFFLSESLKTSLLSEAIVQSGQQTIKTAEEWYLVKLDAWPCLTQSSFICFSPHVFIVVAGFTQIRYQASKVFECYSAFLINIDQQQYLWARLLLLFCKEIGLKRYTLTGLISVSYLIEIIEWSWWYKPFPFHFALSSVASKIAIYSSSITCIGIGFRVIWF